MRLPGAACLAVLGAIAAPQGVWAAGPPPAPAQTPSAAALSIDYPKDGTIFPPEFPAPLFLWRDAGTATQWRIEVQFADGARALRIKSRGEPMHIGELDPRCAGPTNRPPAPTPEQAAAHTWRPDAATWAAIKRHSGGGQAAVVTIGSAEGGQAKTHRASITISTSADPVGAPIFYRDVPLMPSEVEKGVIKPLAPNAQPLIAWRLRNVAETSSRLLLTGMPMCANCHSFSADGKTMGMDLDGPSNDKGLYALVPVERRITIRNQDMIAWRSPQDRKVSPDRVGFMSQVSPDGRYVVTRLSDPGTALRSSYYVANFKDYRFLQVFYPTRGILAWYSREAGHAQPLPGAADPRYVQADGVWTPDGKWIVFARAEARDPYPEGGGMAESANDPQEVPIRYDLYRVPFDEGRGGTPEPIAGASANGSSNSFPKVSPGGGWIVFVKCRNGQLMRPDSELWIVPASGGEARRMRCNTPLMNSWHSFSPNGRWLVFSSKSWSPYTQMFLTHIDEQGNDSPAILIENSTAANRAVNIPEFVNIPPDGLERIDVPVSDYYRQIDLAADLAKKGEFEEAIAAWTKAVALDPQDPKAVLGLGAALGAAGRADAAMEQYRKALELDADSAEAHSRIGAVLAQQGQFGEAIPHLARALALNPQDIAAAGSLCGALALSEGKTADAISYCEGVLKISPADARSHVNLAVALAKAGRLEESVAHLERASGLLPEDATVHGNLGVALAQQGRFDEAIPHFEHALRIAPANADGHYYLGMLYGIRGRVGEALAQWREALRANPDHLEALNGLARLLASSADDAVRNGAEAVTLAERAVRLTGGREAAVLDTLAAAYAEAGRFDDAVRTARRAVELAQVKGDAGLAAEAKSRLALYEAGSSYRQPAGGAALSR